MAILPVLLLLVVMYMLLIRPQQRRVRQHQAVVSSLDVGDEVITAGGVFGTIRSIDDTSVVLEVADGVRVRFLRGAISQRVQDDTDVDDDYDEDYDDRTDDEPVNELHHDDVPGLEHGAPTPDSSPTSGEAEDAGP